MPNQSVEHTRLVNAILLKIGSHPDVRLWKQTTGMGRSLTGNTPIRFGLEGSSDLIGILMTGRFLAIEVKTGNARQSKVQRNFQRMIERFGGLYILARSVSDAVNGVSTALWK